MRIGVDISQHQLGWEELSARARFAEDAGFGSAWVLDHFTALYGDRKGPCPEAYRLRDAYYHPRPVQRPWPPICVGASGRRLTLPIAGRHAQVWHSFGSPEDLAGMWEVVERAAFDAGRDPSGIRRSTNISLSEPWDEVRRTIDSLVSSGVDELVASWPSEGWARIEEFASQVMPSL